jgi:hypothetical protein
MRTRFAIAAIAALGFAAIPGARHVQSQAATTAELASLKTRAESSEFKETSRYDDVVSFMQAVAKASPKVRLTTFGKTFEGRALPLAVVGAPDPTPAVVRKTGKLRVYIQGNIHAGEVEGKESAQMLLRDLDRLRAHGIIMTPFASRNVQIEEFHIQTNELGPSEFQGHRERTLTGTWGPAERQLPAGTLRVDMKQPLARLAFYLLEPRSDDGLLDWNFLDDVLSGEVKVYPIVRTRN